MEETASGKIWRRESVWLCKVPVSKEVGGTEVQSLLSQRPQGLRYPAEEPGLCLISVLPAEG